MKDFLYNRLLPGVTKFTQLRYMKVLMNAFMGITAISIAGSLFTLVKSIPIPQWQSFLASSGLGGILSIPVAITTDVFAMYLVCSMAYQTAKSFEKRGFTPALIALGSFLILTPFTTTITSTNDAGKEIVQTISNVIPVSSLGAQGLFLAMFVGVISSRLYIFAMDKGWKIKMPASVPPNVSGMFEAMIPGGLVFVLFLMIRFGMAQTSYLTAQNFIYTILQQPLVHMGGGLPGFTVYLMVGNFLWLFGIHGSMVTYAAMGSIFIFARTANLAAFAAGMPAPHPEWLLAPWVYIGGGGCTLALNLLMLSRAKSAQMKTLGKMTIPTSIFEINEPIVFGTPIILNPYLAIPFIVAPLVNLFLTYFVMNIGIVAWPTGAAISNFMPIGIFGMLVNAHWTGFVWTFVLIALDLLIYFPFFTAYDKKLFNEEQAVSLQNETEGLVE